MIVSREKRFGDVLTLVISKMIVRDPELSVLFLCQASRQAILPSVLLDPPEVQEVSNSTFSDRILNLRLHPLFALKILVFPVSTRHTFLLSTK